MKKIRRISALALAIALLFSLTALSACNSNKPAESPTGSTAESSSPGPDASSGSDGSQSIKIGWVEPFTGPLASFSVSIKWIAEKALNTINNENGGIYIEEYGKKVPLEIIWADSQSDPAKASEAANKLVLNDKVDFLVGAWTPMTTNPVSAVAEQNEIPALMANTPDIDWLTGGPYHWAFGNMFSSETDVLGFFDAWDTVETNKKVGLVLDNSVDGVAVAEFCEKYAAEKGYTLIDPGRFPSDTNDYTAIISKIQSAGCDIVYAVLVDPSFAILRKQMVQMGYTPKILTLSLGGAFTSSMQALGDLGNGIIDGFFWEPTYPYKSSLDGTTAAQLSEDWENSGADRYAEETLGYDLSTIEVIYDVYSRAQSIDKAAVRDALSQTNLDTIFGHIQYDSQNVCNMPFDIAQWELNPDGSWSRNIVSNTGFPEIPLSPKGVFFLPGSE
jgi:branched-chain amino acid transport system substrate-binding protein